MIGIAADHGAFEDKEILEEYLKELGYRVKDYSPVFDPEDDEPLYGIKIAEDVRDKKIKVGIAMCTSAIGMSITCNKVKKIRCAKIDSVEDAISSRQHNDANMMALAGNKDVEDLKKFIKLFLETEFLGLERYKRRIQEITDYENEH